ncbi:HPr family phosphocarrier protein [Glycomyces tenuis]|uniref:HPr family phosphocarrier protein n=1 Tax=Glycomyces tenuis TaxID=58116 RepID=UPI00042573A2|nr:HPr family phosphocarrier protein [Glycomyces tenuis]
MIERTVIVKSRVGLHARPAKVFAKAAAATGFPVTLSKGEATANAASILAVLALAVGHGDTVTVSTPDDTKEPELAALADLLASDLEEA